MDIIKDLCILIRELIEHYNMDITVPFNKTINDPFISNSYNNVINKTLNNDSFEIDRLKNEIMELKEQTNLLKYEIGDLKLEISLLKSKI